MNKALIAFMFPEQAQRIKEGKCPLCAKETKEADFEGDPLGLREYDISGMCPECQSEVFD